MFSGKHFFIVSVFMFATVLVAGPMYDDLRVGNIYIEENTISTLGTNGDLILAPDGAGSLIIGGGGADGQLLTSQSGKATWQDAPVSTTLENKGDLQTHDGSGNTSLSVGNPGQLLSVNPSSSAGLEWIDPPATSTLQSAYDTSSDGIIQLDGTKSVKLVDVFPPMSGPLFEIMDANEIERYFSVGSDRVSLLGKDIIPSNSDPRKGVGRVANSGSLVMGAGKLFLKEGLNDTGWGTVVTENNIHVYSSDRRNLIPNPSFEQGGSSVVGPAPTCVADSGIAICLTGALKPDGVTPRDQIAAVINGSELAGYTWTYNLAETTYKNKSMLGGASVSADPGTSGVEIAVHVDGIEQWKQSVTSDGVERDYYYPIVGGEVDFDIVVTGQIGGANKVFVDNLYLGTMPEGYIQSIAYENYEEIDLTGSGDFTGGKIAVGRVGNIVTVTAANTLDHVLGSSATSATGILPEWALPPTTNTSNVMYVSSSGTTRLSANSSGSIGVSHLDNDGVARDDVTVTPGSITYLAADAKERTNVFEQKAQSPDKAGFLTFSFFEGEVEGHKVADGSCVKKADYPDYFRNVGTKYGECTVDTANDGVKLPNLQRDGGLFLRAATASNAVGSVQGDAIRNITGHFDVKASENGSGGVFYRSGNALVNSTGAGKNGTRYSFDVSRQVPTANENRPVNMAVYPLVRMWDRETVVGMFKASQIKGLKKKCQTKYLSANVTSTGAIADWTFNNVEVGKKYQIFGKAQSRHPFAGEKRAYIRIEGLSTGLHTFYRGETPSTVYAELHMPSGVFEATDSAVTFYATSLSDDSELNSAADNSWVQLCELPEDTIEFTTEW